MRYFLKSLVSVFSLVLAQYYIFCVRLGLFPYKTLALKVSTLHGYLGIYVRRYFYQSTLKSCGINLNVFYGAYICYQEVIIGNNCTLEEYVVLSKCTLGDDVVLAAGVSVMSGAHHHDIYDIKTLFRLSEGKMKTVNIGDNVWIGTKAIIMNDISRDSIVGAGAVVTKTVNDMDIVAGVPAKVIGSRILNS